VESIKDERNVSWEDAEKIYLEDNKDSVHGSLLDFTSPTLGTVLDEESEDVQNDIKGI